MSNPPTLFPTEPGCYIDGSHGHYALAELCVRYGNEIEALAGHKYSEDPESIEYDAVVWCADKVEDRWNESLPGGKYAGWEDGEFFVVEISSDLPD